MPYGRAKVTPDGTVCLWLGANVMVEYPYDEGRIYPVAVAEERLSEKRTSARKILDHGTRPDLITVAEVN